MVSWRPHHDMVSSAFATKTHLLTASQGEVASLGPPRWENRLQAVTDRCLPHAYERWQRMLMLFGGPINEALSTGNPLQSFFFSSLSFVLFACPNVWFYLLLYLSFCFFRYFVDLLNVTTALVMVSASWMNPLAGRTSFPPCCLAKSTTPTDSASSCLDPDPSCAHTW